MSWEIIAMAEAGGVRGVALSRHDRAELFWVEVETEPQASGCYQVRVRGLDGSLCGSLDEAAWVATRLILSRLPRAS